MHQTGDPVGSVAVALAHAARLLPVRPDAAAAQASEILKVVPGHPPARLILAAARRRTGDVQRAREVLDELCLSHPSWAQAHLERGLALGVLGDSDRALEALRRAVALEPDSPEAWRGLGDQAQAAGDVEGADRAYLEHIRCSTADPELMGAAAALCEGRLAEAEQGLRERLKAHPTDVAAIRMLAELGTRLGRYAEAENLLARCLELSPSFLGARHNYAVVLYRQNKAPEALREIAELLRVEPQNPGFRSLQAAALTLVGEYDRSIETYEQVLAAHPDQAKVWLSYGHALKTAGRQADSIAAYRRALALAPSLGEAYWSLANLKTVRFDAGDLVAMRSQLARDDLSDDERLHLHYALGKAQEDAGEHASAFADYAAGAALRRAQVGYDADATHAQMQRLQQVFTRELFAAKAGQGAGAADPIFVVGLPRSGSTLIEQILSSHSAVEGTMELPELVAIAKGLDSYPERVDELDGDRLRALGETYLERTRVQRKTGRPLFIDKMPNNFVHVGLIQLILPNARIIDARRHPLGACFSAFKQHFARGQHFSYDLTDLGRYYRDYVELMDHFEEVLPGRVHRIHYETMVEDTEGEVRRLLDHCGLPFEPACLRFYENDRAVRTASSEQVRLPIYRHGLDQWRNFEPWLEPLKAALGPALASYPAPRAAVT
ncbi:MAG: sulfotransferase family protein [Phenylobacterium sp.]|nr:MAG: sulfotransferase family protein [Phenylobacterium sp.]